LPLADRATIGNMSPEYGATCGFFPIDQETMRYLRLTGRDEGTIALAEAYAKAQGLWREPGQEPVFTDSLELDLSTVSASLAGPKRPQDRVDLPQLGAAFDLFMDSSCQGAEKDIRIPVAGTDYTLGHGDVVIRSEERRVGKEWGCGWVW